MPERIIAATDGSCDPNPGPCAWAYVIADAAGKPARTVSGAVGHGTNQVAELAAVLALLEDTTGPVTIHADSVYAIRCLTTWLPNWQRNGWLNSAKRPVANRHLIERGAALMADRDVRFTWVRGHNGHPLNEAADKAAKAALASPVTRTFLPPGTPEPTGAPARTESRPCTATTRAGNPCATGAGPNGLCHTHDPALQCGRTTRKGTRCATATGGGPCRTHERTAPDPGQTDLLSLAVTEDTGEASGKVPGEASGEGSGRVIRRGSAEESADGTAQAAGAARSARPAQHAPATPAAPATPEPQLAPRSADWPSQRGRSGPCPQCGALVQQYPVDGRWVLLDAHPAPAHAVHPEHRWHVDDSGAAHRSPSPQDPAPGPGTSSARTVRTHHADLCPRAPHTPAWAALLRDGGG